MRKGELMRLVVGACAFLAFTPAALAADMTPLPESRPPSAQENFMQWQAQSIYNLLGQVDALKAEVKSMQERMKTCGPVEHGPPAPPNEKK
jgi:hypothetical protein